MEKEQPEWGVKLSKYMFIPARIVLALMLFLGIVNAFTMRVSLSMAITRLVVKVNSTKAHAMCPPPKNEQNVSYEGGDFEWSQALQGFILSSFYIGYIITHIPGGLLAEKYGGKYVLCLGILSTALFTLTTPLVIDLSGSTGLIILRVLIGLGEGTTFPAVSMLLAQWIPKKERALIGSLVLGGSIFGTVISNTLTGWLLSNWKWPVVFYVFGVAGLVWFLFFLILCFSDPSKHPYIKQSEKDYLLAEMGQIKQRTDLPKTPFVDILLSGPFTSMLLAQLGHDWGFFIMVTDLQKYMNDVLNFSIKSNGLYSSLPFVSMYVSILIAGYLTDLTIKKEVLSITTSRKVNTTIGAIVPGIFIIGASYAECDHVLVVILFTFALIGMAPYYSGLRLTPMDMSPNYAGTLMAVSNGFSAFTGALVPTIAGLLTPNSALSEWRVVFWLSLGVLSLSCICFCIWGSGEIQPWNEGSQRNKDK